MYARVKHEFKRFLTEESGQGVSEYGAILAWVSVIVALVFGFTNGRLGQGILTMFQTLANHLNGMSSFASGGGGSSPPAGPST